MNIFHHHLEPVEGTGLGDLHLSGKALGEVLENNTVGGGKEGENVLDEMLFVLLEGGPILGVLTKVDLIDGPEACHLVFVHLPNVVVLDGEDDEAVGVLFKERLRQDLLGLGAVDAAHLGGGNTLGRNDL